MLEDDPVAVSAGDLQTAQALAAEGRLAEARLLCDDLLLRQPDDAAALLLRGVIELQAGEAAVAAAAIRRSLERNPLQPVAHALLGDALLELNEPQEALCRYESALQLDPGLLPVHFGRANALLDLRRPAEALTGFDLFLRLQPRHPLAWFNRGNALFALHRYEQAVDSYDAAIQARPAYADAFCNRGSAFLRLKRPELALESCQAAVALDPRSAEAHHLCGSALRELRRPLEALASYDAALQLRPDFAAASAGRGDALLDVRRVDEALAAHELAVRGAPESADAHNSRGNSLRLLGRSNEALAAYDKALALDPHHGIAHLNRGALLMECDGRLEEALASIDEALRQDPGCASALRLRGDVLLALDRPESAVESFAQLLRLQPGFDYAAGMLLHAKHSIADWSTVPSAAGQPQVVDAVRAGRRADTPFSFLAVSDSAAAQLQCARTYAADRAPPSAPLWTGERYGHERIRLAYLSADFRAHALCYLLAGVFERHDRQRFETIAVSLRPAEPSPMGRRVKAAFDRFIDVTAMTDFAAAELLRGLEIDIVVDLTGFTEGCRPRLLAYRPAPVQAGYLGFPGTMGARHIDYILADEFVIPPELQSHYDEHVAYLPECFQANDERRVISAQTPTRAQCGLPPGGFVFCCFNNGYKVNAALFDVWMRVLDRTPGSVLWLLGATDRVRTNLRREAHGRGIEAMRLVFAERRPYADHLARLKLADLFLDTLPFNGGATVSDALWAGLPVLSCAGEAFAARMGGSLLRAVGLPELIARNPSEYQAKAVEFASRPASLQLLRARLAENRGTCALFDTDRARRHLESAYVHMWRRHERGEPPASFAVAADSA